MSTNKTDKDLSTKIIPFFQIAKYFSENHKKITRLAIKHKKRDAMYCVSTILVLHE